MTHEDENCGHTIAKWGWNSRLYWFLYKVTNSEYMPRVDWVFNHVWPFNMQCDKEFYEEDEPADKIHDIFEAGEKGFTAPPDG